MKRSLFQNITAIPYTPGDAIDRSGFLSAVIGATVASGATLTVTVEHSDDGENFVPVTDKMVFPETPTEGGVLTFKNEATAAEAAAGGVVNIDVDLVGLKQFVKFTATEEVGDKVAKEGDETSTDESSIALVVVLGDATAQPV